MAHSLQTEQLTLTYGSTIVIDRLNLQIPKGKITVLVGGNGKRQVHFALPRPSA